MNTNLKMKNKIAIALAPGENHFCHLDRIMASVKRHTSIDYHFCIMSPKLGLKTAMTENVTIKTLTAEDEKLFQEIYCAEGKRKDIPSFVYSQLLIPDYFKEYEKILFLEVDQIVQKDLKDLWELVYNNNITLGAVQDEIPESFYSFYPDKKYYNTGVVVYDTKFWIENNLKNKCFEECYKQKESNGSRYRFYVQGAMNMALHDLFQPLEKKYNLLGLGGKQSFSKDELDSATILHWNGKRKPWNPDGLYLNYYYN